MGLLDLDDLNTTNSEKGTVGIVPSIIVKNKYKNNQDYASQIYEFIKNNKNTDFIIFNHTYSKKFNNFSDNLLIDEIMGLFNSEVGIFVSKMIFKI